MGKVSVANGLKETIFISISPCHKINNQGFASTGEVLAKLDYLKMSLNVVRRFVKIFGTG
jgi:hypothetical protein